MISGENLTPLPSLTLFSEPVIICSSELLIFEHIVEKSDSIKTCVKIAEPFSLAIIKSLEHIARVFEKPVQFKTVVPPGFEVISIESDFFFLLQFKPFNKSSESNFHLATQT